MKLFKTRLHKTLGLLGLHNPVCNPGGLVWDWLLIGDGSGSRIDHPCGWATVGIENPTWQPSIWWGAMNGGSSNMAEMLAYLQPLEWYAAEKKRKKQKHEIKNVHIVTDSIYCQRVGESGDLAPKHHAALWQVFEEFRRQGIVIRWHWRSRDTLMLNRFTDSLSREARLLIQKGSVRPGIKISNEDGKARAWL